MRVPVGIRRFSHPSVHRQQLPFPASPNLRVAQITAASLFDRVPAFSPERWQEFETYHPRVLVGPAADFRKLRDQVELGTVDVTSVDHAIFVLTSFGETPLSDISRVVFWQSFGVPVYELFMSPAGTLLASECQAHEGWHMETHVKFTASDGELMVDAPRQKALPTGLFGRIETAACPCGRLGARVLLLETQPFKDARNELAATA